MSVFETMVYRIVQEIYKALKRIVALSHMLKWVLKTI